MSRVEERIGSQNHDIWIRPIRLLGLDGSQLRLQVPNRYYSDWVRDNYEKVLTEEAAIGFGRAVRIRYQLADEGIDESHSEPEPAPKASRIIGVMRDKQFENYVVGTCNQFAHAAALAVSDFPGQNYNPSAAPAWARPTWCRPSATGFTNSATAASSTRPLKTS